VGKAELEGSADENLQRLVKAAETIVGKFPKGTSRVVALRQ